jgi:hypothetical protein
MRGNGGHWNRAGRLSGGARPLDITPSPEVSCSCGTVTAFGLLPEYATDGVANKRCPGCSGVLFVRIDGRWASANELRTRREG